MGKNIIAGVFWLTGAIASGCTDARGATGDALQGVVEFDERTLAFELPGRVRTMHLARGQRVEAGAPAAELDDSMARPVREARAAELEAARARLRLLQAGARASDVRAVEASLAGLRSTEAATLRSLERARGLAQQGAVAATQVEDLDAQLQRVRSERAATDERLRSLRDGARPQEVAQARSQIRAGEHGLEVETQRLARHALRSPIAGTVLDVIAEPGDVLAAGAAVATVADTAHPYVDVFVPQGRTEGLRVGAAATVRVDASARVYRGRVDDVGRRVEFTPRFVFSERERPLMVLRARVRVDDPEGRLHAGVPAIVTIEGIRP